MARIGEFRKQRRNANKHTERGLKLLSESVDRDGWIGALTVAADGETFDGSARLVTAQQDSQLEPIVVESDGTRPVIVRRTDIATADDPKAKRLGVMANHVTATDWEPDAAVLAEIAKDDAVIAVLAKEDARLAELLRGEAKQEPKDAGELVDKAAELQAKWQVQRGDVWQVGRHRVMCGDSTNAADVARLMGGDKLEAVVTDPPYNLHYGGEGLVKAKFKENLTAFSSTDYSPDGFLKVLAGLSFGSCFIYTSKDLLPAYFDFVRSLEMDFNLFVWCKPNVLPMTKNSFLPDLEYCVYGYKKGERVYINGLDHKEYSKYYIGDASEGRNEGGGLHPSIKPLGMICRNIKTSSNPGGAILDFFCGSGTTLVACEQTGRIGRGMEIEPKYVAVTLERLTALGLESTRNAG